MNSEELASQIVRLRAENKTIHQIAAALGLTEKRVENLIRKLRAAGILVPATLRWRGPGFTLDGAAAERLKKLADELATGKGPVENPKG